jgi:hypothetical protein
MLLLQPFFLGVEEKIVTLDRRYVGDFHGSLQRYSVMSANHELAKVTVTHELDDRKDPADSISARISSMATPREFSN